MTDDWKIEKIPMKDLIVEAGSEEMLRSPNMQPYLRVAEAVVKEEDPQKALGEVAQLPLEKRYVWRIASALKWAFCDYDDVSVEADRITLKEADMKKVLELLRLRPVQFCLFLKALLGEEEMERVMSDAVRMAKQA